MKENLYIKFYFIFLITLNLFIFSNQLNQLDTTFGQGLGYVIISAQTQINSINIQPDDKIIVSGFIQDKNIQFFIARYNTDGNIDKNFGTNGIVTTQIGADSSNSFILSSVLQADGKILAGGYFFDIDVPMQFVIARYNSDGSLDTQFGMNGICKTLIGYSCLIQSIAIQSDGKIIAVGTSVLHNKQNIAVARYTPCGILDTTFSNNGVITELIGVRVFGNALVIDNVGNILVGGCSSDGLTSNKFLLCRFNSKGNLDSSFANNGIALTSINDDCAINSLALDSNNNIIAAGYSNSTNSGATFITLARYNSSGCLDLNFNSKSTVPGVITQAYEKQTRINKIAIDNHDNILIAGYSTFDRNKFFIARYNKEGDLDNTFGINGIINIPIHRQSEIKSFVLQSDNKIIAAGYCIDDSQLKSGIIARFNKNNKDFISIDNIINGSTIQQKTILFSGKSSGNESDISLFLDGILLDQKVTTDNLGNWSFSPYSLILSEGLHTFMAQLFENNKIISSELVTFNINNSITNSFVAILAFNDSGIINNGTRYLRLGTATATLTENPFKLSTNILVKALNVKLLNAPGSGNSVTVTLRKNRTDTTNSITLSNNQTSFSNISNPIIFVAGDTISVSVNGSLLNNASDIIVTLELY